jgi:tyrosine-protein kinase Etk/Wzc
MATETQYSELKESAAALRPSPEIHLSQSEAEEISLLDLLIVLAERRRIIFSITLTFLVVAIVASLILPKSYTATAVLLPPQQNSSIGSAIASQLGSLGSMASLATGGLGIKNPNDMYVAMFRSETVENAMVQKFGLQREYQKRLLSDTRKSFEHHSTVDGSSKDNLIHISVEDRDPQRAADLANGYINEFRHLTEHLAITEAGQRRLFFEQQLEQAKDNLANAEEALKKTEQTTGLIQLDSQARALIESAATLRAQIAAKEVQIQAMRTYATGENAQLVEAQQELDSMRAELAKLGGSEDNNDSLIVPRGRVPEAGLEYIRKLRDVKYYETIFEILARQFEIAKLDEAKEGAVVQVVDPAIKPDRRSFPKRALIVIVATIGGLLIGILVALAQAGWARLKEDPESSAKLALLTRTLRSKTP